MYKVVIIEDEAIIRKGLSYIIDWASLDCDIVSEASNGLEGIEIIKKYSPDIVILDINMPKINGIDMLKSIKEINFQSIILSGYNEFEYAKSAIEMDVCAYLLKPLDEEELIKAVKKAIRRISQFDNNLNVKSNLMNLLNKLDLMYLGEHINNSYSQTTNEVIKIIEENYDKKINMSDLVNATFRSKSSLNSKFKEDTGKTINDFLNRYRIHKSINLIKESNYSIEMISEMVGFSNYRYFITVFKKYLNLTPTEFSDIYLKK